MNLDDLKKLLGNVCGRKTSGDGIAESRGGLESKLKAVQLASMSGVFSIITSGMQGGRIGEISTGLKFGRIQPASADQLPPPGPYLSGKQSATVLAALGFTLTTYPQSELKV